MYLIEIELIYSVVLVSVLQQSDLVMHVSIVLFTFFPMMVYPRILNTVPCAL